jgi:hypothetical protein
MKTVKTTLGWALAVGLPFAVASVYLTLSRWPVRWWSAETDYMALAAAVLAGTVGLFMIVRSPRRRVVGFLAYACAATLTLGWYSLAFVCSIFGDCL